MGPDAQAEHRDDRADFEEDEADLDVGHPAAVISCALGVGRVKDEVAPPIFELCFDHGLVDGA